MNLTKDRKSGTERALIAIGISESVIIIATDGPWIAAEKEACFNSDDAEEVLGDWHFHGLRPGVYLWEGGAEWRCDDSLDCPAEPCIDWKGVVRPVEPEELPALLAMRPPEPPAEPAEPGAPAHEGDWAMLPGEPCRFCRRPGGVHFLIDDGPEGRVGLQSMRCDRCGRDWVADSSSA